MKEGRGLILLLPIGACIAAGVIGYLVAASVL